MGCCPGRKLYHLEHGNLCTKSRTPMRFASARLYNFRFDATQPPQDCNATVGFFKTGSPMTVEIQAPQGRSARHSHQQRQLLHLRRLAYTYANADSDSHSHAHCDSTAYSHTQAESDTKGTPNAASASVRRVALLFG